MEKEDFVIGIYYDRKTFREINIVYISTTFDDYGIINIRQQIRCLDDAIFEFIMKRCW